LQIKKQFKAYLPDYFSKPNFDAVWEMAAEQAQALAVQTSY
jgi:hypothetical protein